jgi:hypothetical protein
MGKEARKGREFEELVARLEKILAPSGAIITSPDHITDLVTGSSREVDVSIKFIEDGIDRLVTVECRDRIGGEDTTWIEQLVTKRNDIGAWKTYSVSSSRFSKPAIAKAKHYGIQIRVFQEITDAEIAHEWATNASKVKFDALRPEIYLVDLKVQSESELSEEFYEILTNDLTMMDLREFFTPSDFPKLHAWLVDPHDLRNFFYFSLSSHYATQVTTGQSIEADFVALYRAERIIVNIPIQSVQQYSSPEETLFQILEGSANHEDHTIKIKVRGRFKPVPPKARRNKE